MLFSTRRTRVAAQAALAVLAPFLLPTTAVSALSLQRRATTCNGHPEASVTVSPWLPVAPSTDATFFPALLPSYARGCTATSRLSALTTPTRWA